MRKPRILAPRELAREIARMLPSIPPPVEDPGGGYHGMEESPWDDPGIRESLFVLRFNLPLLAEVLREIANAIDPPRKRPGRPVSDIEGNRRSVAALRLWATRRVLSRARRGDDLALEDPRIREALALGYDANETAAVLAFARVSGYSGPLADVDVEQAARYFNSAAKGRKTRGFVPRKRGTEASPLKARKEPHRCRDRETPTAPAEPDSPSTSSPSSFGRGTSRASSASPKATPVRSKRATPPRPGPSRSAAPSSATSTRGSRTSATSRPRPERRRKEPDGS